MSIFENQTDLLHQLKAGDASAFEYVYTTYRKWLWIAALGILQHEADAEEIVQEFFIDFWQKQYSRDFADISHLKNYLFICIRNRCINKLESDKTYKKRMEQVMPVSTMDLPCDKLENRELQRKLEAAISKLPPVRSRVFQMGYLLQRSRKEIATALKISEESVKKHMNLALKDLRLAFKNRGNY